MTGRIAALGNLIVLLWFCACGAEASPQGPSGDPPVERRNILLISLDTLRADHLSYAGHERPTSPFLDELAASGWSFSHAIVNTHGTTTSHTTMLTSLYQETHRVAFDVKENESDLDPIPPSLTMVQELLSADGYTTLGVTGGGLLDRQFGFDRGFDVYDDSARSIEDSCRLLLEHLEDAPRDQPVFAFLHTYQVHAPYKPPAAYESLFGPPGMPPGVKPRALAVLRKDPTAEISSELLDYLRLQYDREIRYTDDTLRELFAELGKRGFLKDALVVITSDHGEEFREHGSMGHTGTVYDELLRVPLILLGPGCTPPRVDDRLVSTVDIAPTLLAFAGLPEEPQMEGADLRASPWTPRRCAFAQYADWCYAARSRRWKLIRNVKEDKVELFDLQADPGERHDLSAERPEVVKSFATLLDSWIENRPRLDGEGKVPRRLHDSEFLERLEELGYIDDG